jgi:putative transposase
MIVGFIDEHGVEPICSTLSQAQLPIAVSTYYAARTRPTSARSISDAGGG